MAFRKDMNVNSDIDAKTPSDSSFVGVTTENSNKLSYDVEDYKKLTKDIVNGIVDGTLRAAFRFVEFKWQKPGEPEFTTVVDPQYVHKQ